MVDRWTTSDKYWAAVCIYHEGRGEGLEAQVAVAQVIFNRAEYRGSDVVEEVFRPAQFSWANNGNRPPITEYHSLLMALLQVDECLRQRAVGNRFKGRVFFRDNSMPIPEESIDVLKMGRLTFYNLPGEYGSS